MADKTGKLGLKYVVANQAQKEVTINEDLNILEMLVQATAKGVLSTPPVNPEEGDMYIIGDTPTGAWENSTVNSIAGFLMGVWNIVPPKAGWRIWMDEGKAMRYQDGAWVEEKKADIAALKKLITDTVTQAKKDAILAAHPVGSYYISDNATDPGTLFGGTWKMLDPGLTLISQGKGTDKFGNFEFVAGQTYGERMHQLTVDELANVAGDLQFRKLENTGNIVDQPESSKRNPKECFTMMLNSGDSWTNAIALGKNLNMPVDVVHLEFGRDIPHNNLSPVVACYCWKRTA